VVYKIGTEYIKRIRKCRSSGTKDDPYTEGDVPLWPHSQDE